jgi:anthranilate phosphoribosyltransferase
VLAELASQVAVGGDLSPDQISRAVEALALGEIEPETKADFLIALARKGETPAEIASFAVELRARSIPVPLDAETRAREILDVCGTGGDRLNTFNISTTVALIAAAAGITVAKHGNRAITSSSGSADVLEAMGISVELSPEQAARDLKEHGFAFLFAPRYHPAFKHIGPARQLCAARGERTIFNFLGPLLNPARPTAQLMGVSRPALCEPLAMTLQSLGLRRAMVVSGEVPAAAMRAPNAAGDRTAPAFLDELSTLGPNTVAEFHQANGFHLSQWAATDFPLQRASLGDLAGGNRADNAAIIERLLAGEDRGPKRDAVLLNAGAALFVAGRARSIAEGWNAAEELIESGRATAKLKELQQSHR